MHTLLDTCALIGKLFVFISASVFIICIAWSVLKDDLTEMFQSFAKVIKPWIMLRSEYNKERYNLSQQRIKRLERELGFNEETESFGNPTTDEIILLERMNQRKNSLIEYTKK